MSDSTSYPISARGALFDLDGVIIDSEGLYTQFWSAIEEEFPTGIPNFAHAIKGNTLNKILALYPDETTREAIRRRIHDYENSMRYPLFPGAVRLLDELHDAGIPVALVTSSDDVKMSYLFGQLPELRDRFDAVINGSMVTRSKPDPQGYLMGAEALGRDIAACWVFEDSLQGLEAGMRSGATTIALATTNPRSALAGRAHRIYDAIADITLDELTKLY